MTKEGRLKLAKVYMDSKNKNLPAVKPLKLYFDEFKSELEPKKKAVKAPPKEVL